MEKSYKEMKGVIIEVDLYSQIRLLYTDGESQRSISKRLGISRQTVKKYCEGALPILMCGNPIPAHQT